MHRRNFLQTAGAAAAALSAPSFLSAAMPQKNWRCLIGGNRCGKSTKAAKIVSDGEYDFKLIVCVARDKFGFMATHHRLLSETLRGVSPRKYVGLPYVSESLLEDLTDEEAVLHVLDIFEHWNIHSNTALWADECDPSRLHAIADLFDVAVFSSWPGEGIQGSPFYEECLRMGTVERMTMLPHIRAQLDVCDHGWSKEEYTRRVEGKFPCQAS